MTVGDRIQNLISETLGPDQKTQSYSHAKRTVKDGKKPCNLAVTFSNLCNLTPERAENTDNPEQATQSRDRRPKEWNDAFDTLLKMTEYVNEKSILFPTATEEWKADPSFTTIEQNIDQLLIQILKTDSPQKRQALCTDAKNACRFYARKFNSLCKEHNL